MYGFISAMMAAAVWLTVATRLGLPVSTTHSIIGGIIGVGLVLEVQHQTDLIDWEVEESGDVMGRKPIAGRDHSLLVLLDRTAKRF